MPFLEASHIPAGAVLRADVCVVGAGPAGLAVALELARARRRVLLLEAGGFEDDPDAGVGGIEIGGAPLRNARLRDSRFGGTAWYGRAVTLDPIDFEARPWVSMSGWPLAASDVEPWHAPAARFLGFPRPDALRTAWWPPDPSVETLCGGGITTVANLITRHKDLGRLHEAAVRDSPFVTAVLRATVTGLDVDGEGSRVAAVRAAGPAGTAFAGFAERVVLAAGGLENARLLLRLVEERPGVLGASEAVLGRFYMNHARAEGVARLRLDPGNRAHRGLYRRLVEHPSRAARCSVQFAAALDETTQRRERLLNAAGFFYPVSEPRLRRLRAPLDALRRSVARGRVRRADLAHVRQLVPALPLLAGAAAARLAHQPFRLDHLVMVDQLEQAPDAGSRLTLGTTRDRFGAPSLRIEWRIGAETLRTHRRFHARLAARLRDRQAGELQSALVEDPTFEPAYEDNAHPMGATRMSADPRDGVVDRELRVHALRNLYVAGSSVFPTGGHANPTLTIVALALRLGQRLGGL